MQPFIVIRNYREDDELKCQELVRDYIMSFSLKSFFTLCFREITLQFIVITWAVFFIFLGVPLLFCVLTIPGCVFFLFTSTYFSFYAKAVELMRVKPSQSLVAECYEPFIFRCAPNEASYQIFMDRPPYVENYLNKFRRRIVATVSVKNHHAIYNAAWIYRFAIAKHYPHQKIMEPMINLVSKNCINGGYASLECTISEWQESERDFYDDLGFVTRQIYHKQIIGSTLTVMKTQLTYNLKTDGALQKQN
ncbi:uncharacterized protein LOC6575510 [Drosophila mojavensis]|uniref:N-acetyltransferase domain-containing protein n=1 Tax=Drosophila mojavensis TaxID=7230 RepID=B4KCV8_DROMO|nr:uncharacterized protein LOC6575510 [Drosophila mojavensis]EDW16980.1 uncharacterized protein Dmoj_GI10841 [Drosophila mojavensis]